MDKLLVTLSLLTIFFGCRSSEALQKAETATFDIYFSNDFQGYIEPCG
jgi:hypothetical protein